MHMTDEEVRTQLEREILSDFYKRQAEREGGVSTSPGKDALKRGDPNLVVHEVIEENTTKYKEVFWKKYTDERGEFNREKFEQDNEDLEKHRKRQLWQEEGAGGATSSSKPKRASVGFATPGGASASSGAPPSTIPPNAYNAGAGGRDEREERRTWERMPLASNVDFGGM